MPVNQRTETNYTPYLATAIAEGFCEGEDATAEQKVEAWAYLIETKLAYQMQGFFGRTADSLIDKGLINDQGIIDWYLLDELNEE